MITNNNFLLSISRIISISVELNITALYCEFIYFLFLFIFIAL
jgi:hypothetical protein